MALIKLLGNIKRVIGKDTLIVNNQSINEIIKMLNDNGIDINETIIMVNGIESSLIDKDAKLDDEDIVTIAYIVHGG